MTPGLTTVRARSASEAEQLRRSRAELGFEPGDTDSEAISFAIKGNLALSSAQRGPTYLSGAQLGHPEREVLDLPAIPAEAVGRHDL